jgi:hypothetical protein
MIACFEITSGRCFNDTAEMFEEADEKHEVGVPREQTPVHVIEIEYEINEISSLRKDEINTVDVNDKLQLSKIEN